MLSCVFPSCATWKGPSDFPVLRAELSVGNPSLEINPSLAHLVALLISLAQAKQQHEDATAFSAKRRVERATCPLVEQELSCGEGGRGEGEQGGAP